MSTAEELDALRSSVRTALSRDASWDVLCSQIGVAALAVPEEHGGLGAGLPELAVVAAEFGRVLSPLPFLSTSITALALADSPLAAKLTTGTVAWSGFSADESTVDGTDRFVLDGDTADLLLVVADSLYAVPTDQDGVRRTHSPTMDETRRLATVELRGVRASRVGDVDPSLRDQACVLLAAEQTGAMARAFEITLDYAKQRKQFGRAIGSFQAIKHRLAELYVLVETARSCVAEAAEDPSLAWVAKVHCSEAFTTVAAEMIQLHGGIGITWEHPAHRYFKRAHGSSLLFGAPHEHLRR
ncbi:acyl-CoA dehydrogenase family protein [Amycolatopsis sp. 195334CR]|uniref:acyl-CoA dehydrogenase family protein n=1 Tax=Amycolatopsis sp. 195334CR TaxID=2814588 RepID=UPI001A8DC342|nr:acyl-CoA dehydrogenase family protein [Amycolatopsis sp. 195334CR]MBN6041438.1 acyl-CoA/acyl-ACP dehydrogenase [Amycolatopsis sp. 195334CR]